MQFGPKAFSAHVSHASPAQLPSTLDRVHSHVPSALHSPFVAHLPGHAPLHSAPKYPNAHSRHAPAGPQCPTSALPAHAPHHSPSQCPCVALPKHTHVPTPSHSPFPHDAPGRHAGLEFPPLDEARNTFSTLTGYKWE